MLHAAQRRPAASCWGDTETTGAVPGWTLLIETPPCRGSRLLLPREECNSLPLSPQGAVEASTHISGAWTTLQASLTGPAGDTCWLTAASPVLPPRPASTQRRAASPPSHSACRPCSVRSGTRQAWGLWGEARGRHWACLRDLECGLHEQTGSGPCLAGRPTVHDACPLRLGPRVARGQRDLWPLHPLLAWRWQLRSLDWAAGACMMHAAQCAVS